MRAVGNNIIIKKLKEGTAETKGGLLLAENHREDIRYTEATVISVGELVEGINKTDSIFFDLQTGHKIEYSKETYHIIKNKDVVVVL